MSFTEGALRFILGGTLILVVSLLAKHGKASVAGIMALFPIVTAISFFFIAKNAETKAIQDAVLASIIALPTTLVFLLAFYFCVSRFQIWSTLAFSITSWFITAILIYTITLLTKH